MVKQRKSSLWVALFCFRISCDIIAICGKDSILEKFTVLLTKCVFYGIIKTGKKLADRR